MQSGKPTITLRDRWRYWFDKTMSRGTPAQVALLALGSLTIITLSGAFVSLTGAAPEGGEPSTFIDATWNSLMHAFDPTRVDNYPDWAFRGVMAFATLGGLFVVSAFIGILTTGLDNRLQTLRLGRSRVIERDHTLILGWSPKVFPILSELVIAKASERKPRIVVLAEQGKVDMEEEICARVGRMGRTQIICRTGSPIDPADIHIANPDEASAIIILSPDGDDDPDAQVIKSIMALTRDRERKAGRYHIVAEIQEERNLKVARLVGGDDATLILSGDLISRVMMHTCQQPGLSAVYTELLSYAGSEIYFSAEPSLVGRAYGEAILAYEQCSVAGLRKRGQPARLNPPADTPIEADDELILIAEDDSAVHAGAIASAQIDPSALREPHPASPAPERFLILGWNAHGPTILTELDRFVAPGSEALVVADLGAAEDDVAGVASSLERLAVSAQAGDTTDPSTLEALDLGRFDHVLVLCYSDRLGVQQADARTTVTLLHLREFARQFARQRADKNSPAARAGFNIVSQMLDLRNRELAEVTHADDFIVSDNLVSLILAQVAQNRGLADVFVDLLAVEGSEIYLEPVAAYVETGRPVNFYTVCEAARRRNETAIGYRLHALASDAAKSYGVVINPAKSNQVTFGESDRIIVLAEANKG